MQTNLSAEFKNTRAGAEADAILRKCVHCGFCNATCPTYQLLGDELDGPRGRIYLMKQVLEGASVTRATQTHLDRCLTCRACETTCPSGVEYGRLVEIGRDIVEKKVERPFAARLVRKLLRDGLTSRFFGIAVTLGRSIKPLLPVSIRDKLQTTGAARAWPNVEHARKVLLLTGCVQPSLMPNVNAATARVLHAAGIQTLVAKSAGCCGTMRLHLSDGDRALDDMRRLVDVWWPYLESGTVEAIVMNASGCGVTVKEYARLLAHDPAYADKARRISSLSRDLSELLPDLLPALRNKVRPQFDRRIACHLPCTLQHGQRLRSGLAESLASLGFEVTVCNEAHLCCGSAGTYSILEQDLSYRLRDRKLGNLVAGNPQVIVSANIGCIQQLASGTVVPVKHWVELIDDVLKSS